MSLLTNVYRENNAVTSKLPVATPIVGQKFVSLLNGKLTVGALPSLQHLGVSVESVVTGDCDYIVSGHVRIAGANFTVGKKVAANKYGYIGTVDKLESGSIDRIGGNIYIIGFALTTDTFLLQVDHTKPLVAFLIEGKRYMSELFSSVLYKETSADFPAVCVSRKHAGDSKIVTLNSSNWLTLVPALREVMWTVGVSSPNIAYSAFTPGTVTVITLDPVNTVSNNDLLLDIITTVRYHNDLEVDGVLTGTHYLNLNLVINFNGEDCRIVDVDLINQTITVDYDTTALTTAAGNIKVYPHRLPSILSSVSIPDNLGKAQFRKLKPETTLASGYSPSKLFTDRLQGFAIIDSIISNVVNGTIINSVSGQTFGAINELKYPVTDNINGTPRNGSTTRGNLMTVYIYLYGGQYVA